jgi:transposase
MARPSTKFANISSDKQRQQLTQIWKTHHCHYTRIRAHAVLLSGQGYEISALVNIFGVDRDSVSSWIDRFEDAGPEALEDSDHPGAPPMLDEEEQRLLRSLFAKYPNRPAKVLAELKEQTGKDMSKWTLRDYARRFGLSWKRFRRSLRQKRDERAFRMAAGELAELISEPDLKVVYFDEAGFSLKGIVPYGWQPTGTRYEVPVSGAHGNNVQVLGFEGRDGSTGTYLHKGSVNSKTVIEVFDDYIQTIAGPTVVVLDNASCHTSGEIESRLEGWAKQGLYVYYLPPYSPELNAIERLWKRLKYQLMPADAWERFKHLLQTLTTTLTELGTVSYMPSLQNYAE